jgi:hypothetical protein
MNNYFDELVSSLQSAEDGNLVSVIVYGWGVISAGAPRRSDYQLMIVTERLSARDLRELRPIIRQWTEMGYEMPVIITAEEFGRSLDVFPIEFRLMKRTYRTLYGQDMLAGREASKEHLRWQTELELRGKLLRLRSLAMPAGENPDQLAGLMTESVVTFVRFMRSVPEIVGEETPIERVSAAQRVGEILNVDTSPIIRVLRLRDEPARLMEIEIQDLFASYLDCLTRVVAAVDNL